jgi:hypothetical protein
LTFFVKNIKKRYILSEPDPAIPQQMSILKSTDPKQFLKNASKVLQCDLEELFNLTQSSVSRRVMIIRKKMALEQNFHRHVIAIKSQIKP